MASPARAAGPHRLDFIGDHLAINFINTFRRINGKLGDTLQSDDDVKSWLARAEVPVAPEPASWPDGALLQAARRLREIALTAVVAKKAGETLSLEALNAFLGSSVSHCVLVRHDDSRLEIQRVYRGGTPEEYLAPVAESVADLLVNGDFELVRQCEGGRCVLWFYDRTKSHHRRWCSAAGCGNRAKVAAYRARAREQ